VIWLLRHGDAEDEAADDASRRLTEKGEQQALAAGRALAILGVQFDACLTSPKVRAAQTARIVCREVGGPEPEEVEGLRGGDFEIDQLAAGRGELLLVGHEPDFSRAIGTVTGGRVELKKGGVAVLDGETLAGLLRPAELRALADR
jgi:phosphohistidine phosphatase